MPKILSLLTQDTRGGERPERKKGGEEREEREYCTSTLQKTYEVL